LRAAKSARVPSASQYATSGAMVTSMDTSSQAPDTLTPDTPVPIAHRPVGQITRKQQRDQRRLSAQPRFR
jgi:hypothetical protein